jgi:hypothetical protein
VLVFQCRQIRQAVVRLVGVARRPLFYGRGPGNPGELTDAITRISDHQVSDREYNEAAKLFGEAYLVQRIMAIIAIDGWNRKAYHAH